jgi:hypothetical protein
MVYVSNKQSQSQFILQGIETGQQSHGIGTTGYTDDNTVAVMKHVVPLDVCLNLQ